MDNALSLVWLSAACASISYTLTKTPMFGWAANLFQRWTPIYYLWQCPYCMGHYVAFFLVAVYQPRPFTGHWVDYLAAAFVIVTLQTYMVQAILLLGRANSYMKKFEGQ
jgi:hypothetical protein